MVRIVSLLLQCGQFLLVSLMRVASQKHLGHSANLALLIKSIYIIFESFDINLCKMKFLQYASEFVDEPAQVQVISPVLPPR